MTEVASLLNVPSGSNILSVQQFKGLSLEPPTKDVVSNQKKIYLNLTRHSSMRSKYLPYK